jgi:putative addiction module component (TIGR02574 family)
VNHKIDEKAFRRYCVSQDCNETVGTLRLPKMIKEKIPELQRLSAAEKFALAIELWDELSSKPDEIPVTEEQLNEMDRRFEEYQRDPDKVVSWEDVKARILSTRP